VVTVHDGDTITLLDVLVDQHKIRLAGIDAQIQIKGVSTLIN
jgi:endonuclease YncB( thermonuclease family)